MDKFDRLDRKLVHKGTIINMYEDTVRVSNGNVVHLLKMVKLFL